MIGQLPPVRINPSPPLYHTSVDYACPVLLKIGNRWPWGVLKRISCKKNNWWEWWVWGLPKEPIKLQWCNWSGYYELKTLRDVLVGGMLSPKVNYSPAVVVMSVNFSMSVNCSMFVPPERCSDAPYWYWWYFVDLFYHFKNVRNSQTLLVSKHEFLSCSCYHVC